ncbi:MAG: fibronectin type III domain-containing protein [Planctomycetes bacterium]|nr:fibronectin type III domain-containing protein [Planctomycetota bacterium]
MLLDIEELRPAQDVVAAQGEQVPFEVVLGPEHNPEATTIAWSVDGEPTVGQGARLLVDTSTLRAGTHAIEADLRQGDETGSVVWLLQVRTGPARNRAPSILQALPPGPVSAPRGSEISFSVVASDVDAGDDLAYRWSVDGEAAGTGGPSVKLDTGTLAPGSHRVQVVVRDGTGRHAEEETRHAWSIEMTAADARFPAYLSAAWPIGSPRIAPDGRLRFEVEAQVPEAEDQVTCRWEVDGILQQAAGPVFHFAPAAESEGDRGASSNGAAVPATHRVTCRLLTGQEETGEAPAAVGWTLFTAPVEPFLAGPEPEAANAPPVLRSSEPLGSVSVIPGDTQAFRVDAEDPDGDILTYRWLVNGVPQAASGPVFTYTGRLEVGPTGDSVEVVVEDGRGGEARAAAVSHTWEVAPAAGRLLSLTLPAQAVVLDNGQAGTSSTGDWPVSTAGGAYGSSSLYSKVEGNTYVYDFRVPAPGRYEVLLWWTAWSSRSTSVPVKIAHAAGFTTVKVDQTVLGARWSSLGAYDFSSAAKVTIQATGGGYSTCADAAALSPAATSDSGGTGDPAPAASEIVIDDGSAGTSSAGTWSPSSGPSPYGGRSLYAKGSGSYTFQRALSASAEYDVYAWWTEWTSRDSAVPYEVAHAGGTSVVKVDQRTGGGRWNLLGRYAFGTQVKVTVRVPGTATVCADAVRFVPAGSAPPPDDSGTSSGDIIVDNGGPGTSADGVWSISSAPSPYGATSLYAKDRGAYVYDVALPASGVYGVYAWYTEWTSRESAVPYEIRHASGTGVAYVDQRTGGGRWTPLGDFTFGTTARITVRVVDSSTVCADAVRFVPGGGAGAPPSGGELPPPPSSTEPQITELAAFALTPTLARVSWGTSFLGDSVVSFGTSTSADGTTVSVAGSRWDHSVLLESLSADRLYYVKVRSSGGGISKTSPVVSFRTPDPTPSYMVVSSHPRIYFTQAEVPSIRARLDDAPFDAWWSSLASFSSAQLSRSLSELRADQPYLTAALAFAGLIGDVSSWRDKAIAVAMSVAALASTSDNKVLRDRVDFLVPVYDWLHGYLSSTQKSTLRSKLAGLAASLEGRVQDTEYADGHSNGDQNAAFLAALAIYGEDSSAAGIVSRALVRYNEGFWPFWREHGSESGGSFKSTWYTTVATRFNYEVFAAWKSATGKNLYQAEGAWFHRLADWYLHSFRGDVSWHRHGDVIVQQGVDEVERHILVQIAREFKDTDAQWLAERIRDHVGVWGPNMVQDILWHDPSVAARAPTQATSRHFKGAGMVFVRESWKDDCVQAFFRAAPYYMGGHNHLDQCSFAIFYRRGQALHAGIYDAFGSSHGLNYYTRSIAHNTILVEDPDEVFKLYGDAHSADGGQYWLTPSRVPYPFPQRITDLTGDDGFHIGGVKAYEDTSLYTYAVADGAPAYNPVKMAAFHRHFLWIKTFPGWSHAALAVFDEVEATKSTFRKAYVLHTQQKPVVSGPLVYATNGGGMLYQRTVFPQSPAITLVGGAGREYYVDGVNYAPGRSPKEGEEAGAWRVEVSPSASRLHDELLHVLYPTEAGHAQPPALKAVDAASMKGLESGNLVVLFAVKLQGVTSVSYSTGGARRNLLFGLTPGRAHDIYLNGSRLATRDSTVSGTLDFTTDASGKVDVVRR